MLRQILYSSGPIGDEGIKTRCRRVVLEVLLVFAKQPRPSTGRKFRPDAHVPMVRSSWIVCLSPVRLRDLVGSRDQATKDTGSLSDSGMGDGAQGESKRGNR